MVRFTLAAAIAAASLIIAAAPAEADDAACLERFRSLVADGNPDRGPVRIHVLQTVGNQQTENYFYSAGGGSGDGLMEPVRNMGDMWVLFRNQKMYTSNDAGKTWAFGRDMDDASQPEAYKAQVRKDLETAAKVACAEEALDGVAHDTVEGEFNSSALQGAATFNKYWINRETGWLTRYVSASGSGAGKLEVTQTIEPAPDLQLPNPE
jgi:hypothetical protein